MKVKLEKYVSIFAQNESFTIGSLLDPSMKLRIIDPGSKNGIMSTVQTIMETYSLTRDLRDVSVEIYVASMRHEFLQAEMEALLDTSELRQIVGLMEELDLYATAPPVLGTEVLHWWKTTCIYLMGYYPNLAPTLRFYPNLAPTLIFSKSSPNSQFFIQI